LLELNVEYADQCVCPRRRLCGTLSEFGRLVGILPRVSRLRRETLGWRVKRLRRKPARRGANESCIGESANREREPPTELLLADQVDHFRVKDAPPRVPAALLKES
jgi:hypothetical protein